MKDICLTVDEKLESTFREVVTKRFGKPYGSIGKAYAIAIELYCKLDQDAIDKILDGKSAKEPDPVVVVSPMISLSPPVSEIYPGIEIDESSPIEQVKVTTKPPAKQPNVVPKKKSIDEFDAWKVSCKDKNYDQLQEEFKKLSSLSEQERTKRYDVIMPLMKVKLESS